MIFYDLNLFFNEIEKLKSLWKKIIWTNGCYDILHPWHIETFKKCKEIWDILIVWLNWDDSPYWKTKPWRPINDEKFRSIMLSAIKYIDYIYIFNNDTPIIPVEQIKPSITIKGWDYIQDSIKWLVVEKDWFIDLTHAYKYMIEKWIEKFKNEKWFMPEWVTSVLNWWKVYIIPTIQWYSTSNIVKNILLAYT